MEFDCIKKFPFGTKSTRTHVSIKTRAKLFMQPCATKFYEEAKFVPATEYKILLSDPNFLI